MSRYTRSEAPAYLSEIGDAALLTAEQERELALRIARGDAEARDRLVRANLRLVVAIARKHPRRSLPLEDLIAEGNLGLIRAAEAFDPDAGVRFSTYASYWIKQSIARALMNQADVVRRPAHVHKLLARWNRASAALTRELGRAPQDEEIGRALNLSPRRLALVASAIRATSLTPVSENADQGGSTLERLAVDGQGTDPISSISRAESLGQLADELDRLGAREASVLRLRFGLAGDAPLTLRQVGSRLGLSGEAVRRLERRALNGLAETLQA
jgi:RNA polymerase primary sigma factor